MAMRRWSHTERNVLLEQRPSAVRLTSVAEKAKWHSENVEWVSFTRSDRSRRHIEPSFGRHEIYRARSLRATHGELRLLCPLSTQSGHFKLETNSLTFGSDIQNLDVVPS